MIRASSYCKNEIKSNIAKDELRFYKDNAELLWVDLESPKEDELAILSEVFGFHELAIEDCIFPQNQPKIDEFEDYIFIVIYALLDSKEQNIEELNIFCGKSFVVTVHERPIPVLTNLLKRTDTVLQKGSDSLLHSIIDGVVDSFVSLVDRLDAEIDRAEEDVVENPAQDVINKLFDLKKRVISLRRIISPQQRVIRHIARRESNIIREEMVPYFNDILDHIERINGVLESFRDVTTNILQVGFSNISNQMAQIIKVLTVIATIMMPLTLITSYYGMNFEKIPFGWGFSGYLFAVFVMVSVAFGMLFFFRKKGWI
jgi:magnesium transporter